MKRLVLKVIPDEATRLAALKRGEIDIACSVRGELAEELRRTPGLTLKPVSAQGTFGVYFADQWDPIERSTPNANASNRRSRESRHPEALN